MLKGVNLGNWLVLEKWMSPELFAGTSAEDEMHLWRELSETAGRKRFTAHRDSWVTERDFVYLAAHGIQLARIPIPFFIFGDQPPYIGCIDYLDRAFGWAQRHGLVVLIDLHTVPGGQNGFDNSGICGVCIADAQLRAWEPAVAWTYWSYKLQTTDPQHDPWDMGRAIELRWLPEGLAPPARR